MSDLALDDRLRFEEQPRLGILEYHLKKVADM